MPMVPSVTIKGSIPTLAMRKPLSQPASRPAPAATSTPTRMTETPSPMWGRSAFIDRIISPAMKAAIDPTERSMPPEVMTKVMPTAMMPMKAERASTFVTLP